MPDAGPTTWSTPFVAEGFWLDGDWFEAQRSLPALSGGSGSPGVTLKTMGSTEVEQRFWIQGDAPVGVQAQLQLSMAISLQREADYWKLESWRQRGRAQEIWFDWPMEDEWYVPGGETGQTEWKVSRRTPWNQVPGITQTERPPRAYLDGTEMTLVASPPSDDTEFSIPDTSGFLSVETVALSPSSDTWLTLRYHPIILARLDRIDFNYQNHNNLVYTMQITEVRGASFGA